MGILHLNSGNVNLIDTLTIPASIILNDRLRHCNRAIEKDAGINFISAIKGIKTRPNRDEEFSIRICQREIRVRIIHCDNSAYIVIGINYNKSPGYMVLSGSNNSSITFSEFIRNMDNTEGIKKILLVDDNLTIIETYQDILSLLGYETFQFTCPAAALNSMEHKEFDLLISDYDMPGMNGLELLKSFYNTRPGLPVIIISGSVEFPGSMFRSEFQGQMISFMNKPTSLNDLSRSLEVIEFFYKLCRFCCGE